MFLLTLGLLAAGPPAGAQTVDDPARLAGEVQAARQELDRLRSTESAAVEAANAAADDLARASGRSVEARRRADAARDELAVARQALEARAVAAYKGGGGAAQLAAILEANSPMQALERARYLRDLGGRDRQRVERVNQASEAAASLEAAAQDGVEEQIAASSKRDLQLGRARAALDAQGRLLAGLDTRHRAAVQAAEERQRVQEEASARAALAMAGSEAVPQVHVAHEGLQKAIDTALAQVGTPYVWAGERPGGFDCSGLVRYAFLAAGVSVPHRADLQWYLGSHPSREQLQPGDLVFYSTDGTADGIHHVGIYLGHAQMVVAPYTGAFVRVQSFDRPDYFGATRLV